MRKLSIATLLLSLILGLGCQHSADKPQVTPESISQKYIIADLHVDVPYRLEEQYADISVATESGDFDYP